jgi:hypothetical protein
MLWQTAGVVRGRDILRLSSAEAELIAVTRAYRSTDEAWYSRGKDKIVKCIVHGDKLYCNVYVNESN